MENKRREDRNFALLCSAGFGILVGVGTSSVALGVAAFFGMFMFMIMIMVVFENLDNDLNEIKEALKNKRKKTRNK